MGALQEIDRVDKLVFPLLKTKDKYLTAPRLDIENPTNKELRALLKSIESVITESLDKVDHKVRGMTKHCKVLEKRSD